MKTAIVYYSLNGSSEFVAKNLAGGAGGEPVAVKPGDPQPYSHLRNQLLHS